ncbi:MAG: class I SAM-dependent DNA methyltransferase [Candidatus Heimdallarchaeota archaeon]
MTEQETYKALAKYYDKIYNEKNYKQEVEELKVYINKYKESSGKDLLDVACGTGGHLKYFIDDFECVGVDLNQEILDIAIEKFPNVDFTQANMIDMKLDKKFDIITCLFSSIGYIKTKEKLAQTINGFSAHLKKGGVVLIEPWLTKEIFREDSVHMAIYDSTDLKIARLNNSEIDGDLSTFDMHYLIAEVHQPVKYFVEKHELMLFPHKILLDFMALAGLIATKVEEGSFDRGLLIGVKL